MSIASAAAAHSFLRGARSAIVCRMPQLSRGACALLLWIAGTTSGCSSLSFQRQTETSGRFSSSGWAMTILAVDMPKSALQIARENASDANMANMQIEKVLVVPDFGGFNWILDIFSIRYARIEGSWGFSGN
jgi:hypothetical protein